MLEIGRERFNRTFDPERLRQIRAAVAAVAGEDISFPLSPTPVFVGADLARQLTAAVAAFFAVVRQPAFHREAAAWVPERYRAAGDPQAIPQVSCFDFALGCNQAGELKPWLLECQGFSSLMGIVPWYGELLRADGWDGFTPFLTHPGWDAYCADLTATLGDSILVDIEPPRQRLRTDFQILRRFAGIEVADLTPATVNDLVAAGERLYCRVVPAEAESTGRGALLAELCRKARTWVSHPDWFFMLSKHALPHLGRASRLVPETCLLTAASADAWRDRADVVLKPCNRFGGSGVELSPAPGDLARALASGEPHVLQERITLVPVVQPPDGPPLYCDLRVLCLGDRAAALMCRLARNRLCNIARNQEYPWCGITVGLMPVAPER
jgi:hypothetical protein